MSVLAKGPATIESALKGGSTGFGYTDVTTSSASLTRASDQAGAGTWSAKAVRTGNGTVYARGVWGLPPWVAGDELTVKFRFRMSSTNLTSWMDIWGCDNVKTYGSGGTSDFIRLRAQGTTLYLYYGYYQNTTTTLLSWTYTTDAWHLIELRFRLSKTAGSGFTQALMDTVSKGTSTAANMVNRATGNRFDDCRFGMVALESQDTAPQTLWVDDAEIIVGYTGGGDGGDVTAPGTPSGLVATPGIGRVSLAWTANTETDLKHYQVFRSTTSGSFGVAYDSAVPDNSYLDAPVNGLTAGTTYYYKVAAVDQADNISALSSQVSAVPTAAPVVTQTQVSRGELVFTAVTKETDGTLKVANGASVLVKKSDGTNATIYSARTGTTTLSNPLTTDSNGDISGWVPRGDYEIVVTPVGLSAQPSKYVSIVPGGAGAIDSSFYGTKSIPQGALEDAVWAEIDERIAAAIAAIP